jgi:hypothetical protein
MQVDLLSPEDPNWDSTLRNVRHDVYHRPAWASASQVIDGGKPLAAVVSGGEHHVLVPVLLREIPGGSGLRDATSPYGYASPARSGDAPDPFVDDALRAVGRCLGELGAVTWFLRLHPLLDHGWHPRIGTVVPHGLTVSMDLTLDDATYRAQLRGSHRREIARARQSGVLAVNDRSVEHLERFLALYEATMRRVGAADYYLFPRRYFDSLARLGEDLQLWVALADDVVIAGALFCVTRGTGIVQYHLSAADPGYRQQQPTKLLIDSVRAWGAENGLRQLHLGGGRGSTDDPLFRFKRGFSADTYRFRTVRVRLDEAAYVDQCRKAGVPVGDDTGFFPAYRSVVSG